MTAKAGAELKPAWPAAVGGAGLLLLVPLLLFHYPPAALHPTPAPAPPRLSFERRPASGEADFFDPAPLFLPSRWDAKPRTLTDPMARSAEDDFRYAPWLKFSADAPVVVFPPVVDVPEKPLDAVDFGVTVSPFLGMGRTDAAVPSLPERTAMMEMRASGGRIVLRRAITDVPPPETAGWQPMEFLAAIGPSGLTELSVLSPGANATEVVAYFRNYLARTLRLGGRLEPGSYVISLGP